MRRIIKTLLLSFLVPTLCISQEIEFKPLLPDKLTALKDLKKSARKGSSKDKVIYADILLKGKYYGIEVKEDREKAVEYYLKAYEQDKNNIAAYRLSYVHKSVGNAEKSLGWLIKASEQGNPLARFEHGKLLYEGKLLEKDWKTAEKLLLNTDGKNAKSSYLMLGRIYSSPESINYGINSAFKTANKYFKLLGTYSTTIQLQNEISTFEKGRDKNREIPDYLPINFEETFEDAGSLNFFVDKVNKVEELSKETKNNYITFAREKFRSIQIETRRKDYESLKNLIQIICKESQIKDKKSFIDEINEIISTEFLKPEETTLTKNYVQFIAQYQSEKSKGCIKSKYADPIIERHLDYLLTGAVNVSQVNEAISYINENNSWLKFKGENIKVKLAQKGKEYLNYESDSELSSYADFIKENVNEDFSEELRQQYFKKNLNGINSLSSILNFYEKIKTDDWLKHLLNSSNSKKIEGKILEYSDLKNFQNVRVYIAKTNDRKLSYPEDIQDAIRDYIEEEIAAKCNSVQEVYNLKQAFTSSNWVFSDMTKLDSKSSKIQAEPLLQRIIQGIYQPEGSTWIYDIDLTGNGEFEIIATRKYDNGYERVTHVLIPLEYIDLEKLKKIIEQKGGNYYTLKVSPIGYHYKNDNFVHFKSKTKDGKIKNSKSAFSSIPEYKTKQDAQSAVNAITSIVNIYGGSNQSAIEKANAYREIVKDGFTRLRESRADPGKPRIGDYVIYRNEYFPPDYTVSEGALAVVAIVKNIEGLNLILDTEYFLFKTKDESTDWYKHDKVCLRYHSRAFGPVTDGITRSYNYAKKATHVMRYFPEIEERKFTNNGRIMMPSASLDNCLRLEK